MSRTEPRRPLRLLHPAEVAGRPAATVAQAAAQQSADRFRRTLGAARRPEAAESAASGSANASSGASPAQPPLAASHGPEGPGPKAAAEPRTSSGRTAAPVAARGPATILPAPLPQDEEPAPETVEGHAPGDGPDAPTVAADDWPERMASTIASLCARADPAIVNWTDTIPMDPAVLPETTLQLSLSQHWLALRFSTQSPHAHHLVCRYRPRLLEQLERLPQLPHGIDIEVL